MADSLDLLTSVLEGVDKVTLGALSKFSNTMENLSEAARTKVRHVIRGLTGSQRVGQNAGDLTALGVEAGTGLALFKGFCRICF